MSAAYKNVLGGSLKLKGKGPVGAPAPVRRPDAPRSAAPDASSAAPCLSGSKRKADVSADSSTHAPPSKRSDHRLDAPSIASPTETKEAETEAGAGKPSADSKPASVADRRTAAQKAHDEALAKRKEELARKAVSKSHRQRVEELNQLLATTPEHYDLFKISYAGIG